METGAIVAIVASAQIIILTIVQSWLAARKDTRDYARQDAVAERVAVAARQLVDAQAITIARADEVARVAAISDQQINEKLSAIDEQGKKIHILVNSDMTAARTNERDQTRLTLLALKRVQALSANLGQPIGEDEEKAIKVAEKRIIELDQILADRLEAQRKVELETAREKEKP